MALLGKKNLWSTKHFFHFHLTHFFHTILCALSPLLGFTFSRSAASPARLHGLHRARWCVAPARREGIRDGIRRHGQRRILPGLRGGGGARRKEEVGRWGSLSGSIWIGVFLIGCSGVLIRGFGWWWLSAGEPVGEAEAEQARRAPGAVAVAGSDLAPDCSIFLLILLI